jgi:hypothetical protein
MSKLLNKAKVAMTNTDLRTIIDDIANIAKILTNSGKELFENISFELLIICIDEPDDVAQVRRTGQEMAIRRGQSSKFNISH